MNPQITYRGMEHSPAMDTRIRELCEKLEKHHPNITSCHVVVDMGAHHKQKGNHFQVRVDVHVPHHEIVASLQEHEDPYAAMNEAFHVVIRQLDEDIERKRRQVKRHAGEGEDRTQL